MQVEDTIEENEAVNFAKQMVPLINKALFGAESSDSTESPQAGQATSSEASPETTEPSIESSTEDTPQVESIYDSVN